MFQRPEVNLSSAVISVMPAATKVSSKKKRPKKIVKVRGGTRNKLKHLNLLPVRGPDSAIIAAYNGYLLAYSRYLIEADTQMEADVTISDALGCKIVDMPAHSPEGMLIKINVAASLAGETTTAFPWNGKDFHWDKKNHSSTQQIEYTLIERLRDDIRGMRAPELGVSPELASLLSLWREKDSAANSAMTAADLDDKNSPLAFERDKAVAAEIPVRFAILNHPAKSFADILAKFSIAKAYADEEDFVTQMNDNRRTITECVMWSIVGDLSALHERHSPTAALPTPCRVAEVADQFRQCIDRFDEVDRSKDEKVTGPDKKDTLSTLHSQENSLKEGVSFERASSLKGALYQIGVAASFVDVLCDENQHPVDKKDAEAAIYRLLFSATEAIASLSGISKSEYAGDFFLNVDPFKHLGG